MPVKLLLSESKAGQKYPDFLPSAGWLKEENLIWFSQQCFEHCHRPGGISSSWAWSCVQSRPTATAAIEGKFCNVLLQQEFAGKLLECRTTQPVIVRIKTVYGQLKRKIKKRVPSHSQLLKFLCEARIKRNQLPHKKQSFNSRVYWRNIYCR